MADKTPEELERETTLNTDAPSLVQRAINAVRERVMASRNNPSYPPEAPQFYMGELPPEWNKAIEASADRTKASLGPTLSGAIHQAAQGVVDAKNAASARVDGTIRNVRNLVFPDEKMEMQAALARQRAAQQPVVDLGDIDAQEMPATYIGEIDEPDTAYVERVRKAMENVKVGKPDKVPK